MRCLAVCQDELVIRMLDEILLPGFEVEFIVENRPLARRLHEADVTVSVGDPRRTDTWVKADLGPSTCVIIEDNGRRNPRKILEAVRDAGGALIYVLGIGTAATGRRAEEFHTEFPDVAYLSMSELFGGPLLTEFSRSLTRARVQQYQRYFSDADRVLIMLHNDPDPDAMASGLALRNILRRTKTTAIIGAIQGVTRPENLRMVNLLDIHVEAITYQSVKEFDRVAMVDVQPHYFGGAIDRVDLVIDHHPEQPGYTAVFKDVRADYGSTSTILTEHLRAVDVNISERTATAMLYAIKSDTLFFNRQTNRVDLEAFSYLYPLADAALIRKMEGAEITLERLDYVLKAYRGGTLSDQVFCAFLGPSPREDFIPYVADFFLQLEDAKWTVIAGIVGDMLVLSVRNLGYSKNAGEFVRRFFADIGSAGGHRAMAKAVIPMRAFREKFGDLSGDEMTARLHDFVNDFLQHEQPKDVKSVKSDVGSLKSDVRNEIDAVGHVKELKTR
jgi:nanoRNase/pAp phosphatase (c-di-AMP/oligoRNAs hydrolase)